MTNTLNIFAQDVLMGILKKWRLNTTCLEIVSYTEKGSNLYLPWKKSHIKKSYVVRIAYFYRPKEESQAKVIL